MRLQPLPTLATAASLVILLNLGFWQVRRHGETEDFLTRVRASLDEEPLRSGGQLVGPTTDLEWRKAKLQGEFSTEPTFLITGRYEFSEPGFDVVQPFQVRSGPRILVNRGWIPTERWQTSLAEITLDGEQAVEGLLLELAETSAGPIPASGDKPERWQGQPSQKMASRLEGTVGPMYLVSGQELLPGSRKMPEGLPVTGYYAMPKTRPHLQYAGTWFLIAGTLLSLWLWATFWREDPHDPPEVADP